MFFKFRVTEIQAKAMMLPSSEIPFRQETDGWVCERNTPQEGRVISVKDTQMERVGIKIRDGERNTKANKLNNYLKTNFKNNKKKTQHGKSNERTEV